MDNVLKTFVDYLSSEDGKKSIESYLSDLEKKEQITNSQYERFHNKIYSTESFNDFVERIQTKYKSKKYINHWYGIGIIPPESWYFFLFEYASKYGEECTDEEYEKYGCDFTSAIFKIHNYYFELISGQGSFIHIFKNEKD